MTNHKLTLEQRQQALFQRVHAPKVGRLSRRKPTSSDATLQELMRAEPKRTRSQFKKSRAQVVFVEPGSDAWRARREAEHERRSHARHAAISRKKARLLSLQNPKMKALLNELGIKTQVEQLSVLKVLNVFGPIAMQALHDAKLIDDVQEVLNSLVI